MVKINFIILPSTVFDWSTRVTGRAIAHSALTLSICYILSGAKNEFWHKMGYSSTCMEYVAEMLAPGRAIEWWHDRLPLPWQRNLRQSGYNSTCVRDISEIFASNRVFCSCQAIERYQSNSIQRPILVAMATEFETKWVITQLLWEISLRCLHLVGGFSGSGYWMIPEKFYHGRPRCQGSKICDTNGYNSTSVRDISEMFASNGGFLSNNVSPILKRPTPVAVTTIFDT